MAMKQFNGAAGRGGGNTGRINNTRSVLLTGIISSRSSDSGLSLSKLIINRDGFFCKIIGEG